uniref:Uncharacterized protein n=1 Tax=Romanomermis culicivorax TaxID=13658 RepID=A0A915IP66_ROMCU
MMVGKMLDGWDDGRWRVRERRLDSVGDILVDVRMDGGWSGTTTVSFKPNLRCSTPYEKTIDNDSDLNEDDTASPSSNDDDNALP